MKLALVGWCRDTRALLRAAAAAPDVQVVAAFDAEPPPEELSQLFPRPEIGGDWESLLAGGNVDAVIVAARTREGQRDEVLRRLAQAGVPTLVVHPACEPILAYELDMICRDSGCPLLPYFAGIDHPVLRQAARLGQNSGDNPLGTLEQLTMERSVDHLERQHVLDCFARDMFVVRQIVGDIDQVSAMGSVASGTKGNTPNNAGDGSIEHLQLSVNLTSHNGQLVRWTVNSRQDPLGTVLRIAGTDGWATLTMPDDSSAWQLECRPPFPLDAPPSWDGPRAALDRLRKTIEGHPTGPDWSEACRDLEIADSVAVSLRRRRTIQLHHEQHTEEGSFKGIMAVGGCGLLLLGLLLLIGFSVVEGFRTPGGGWQVADQADGDGNAPTAPTSLVWRLWPVYPFALFLLLQLLRLVFRSGPRRDVDDSSSARSAPEVPAEPVAKSTTNSSTNSP
jgi:predicted dehydrogenase